MTRVLVGLLIFAAVHFGIRAFYNGAILFDLLQPDYYEKEWFTLAKTIYYAVLCAGCGYGSAGLEKAAKIAGTLKK
jgi:hypothetical protein